ncbi:MAG: hypothetical protein M0R28_17655 [Pigmentiphaga sp.]|nr:hypothetical protein [Pigmentiphaga sp.]
MTTTTTTETTIRTINATVTAYDGEEPCDWIGYVAGRLAEIYPGAYVDVTYGQRNEAFADSEPLEGFDEFLTAWWDELCNDAGNPAWGEPEEDEEDVEVQVEVTSVRALSDAGPDEGVEAELVITIGGAAYEGEVTLFADHGRPTIRRHYPLTTCGTPLEVWASDRVIDALAAAEGAGLDRVAIIGEIEAHVTEAAAALK